MGQWDEFPIKNGSYYLHKLSWHFFVIVIVVVFHQKMFLSFLFIFLISIEFPEQILTNQKPDWLIRNCQWKCMYKLSSLFMCHTFLISDFNNSF